MGTANPNFNLISSEAVEGTASMMRVAPRWRNRSSHDRQSFRQRPLRCDELWEFLGLGHSHYPLPWNAIKYDDENQGYIANVTEEQLKDAPEFSDDSWTDRDSESRWHQHFQSRPYWEDQGVRGKSQGPTTLPPQM